MQYRHLLVLGMLFFVSTSANTLLGQQGMDSSTVGNVHVHIVYPSDRSAGLHLRVRLVNSGNTPISETFTNDQGRAEFTQIPVGQYHVIVTGDRIEDTDSGEFEIDRRKTSQDLFITVR